MTWVLVVGVKRIADSCCLNSFVKCIRLSSKDVSTDQIIALRDIFPCLKHKSSHSFRTCLSTSNIITFGNIFRFFCLFLWRSGRFIVFDGTNQIAFTILINRSVNGILRINYFSLNRRTFTTLHIFVME